MKGLQVPCNHVKSLLAQGTGLINGLQFSDTQATFASY